MLHAEIRNGRDALHFFCEATAYNLQTLRQHVHDTAREEGHLQLRVQVDPADQETFDYYTQKWLPTLADRQRAVVEVTVTPLR